MFDLFHEYLRGLLINFQWSEYAHVQYFLYMLSLVLKQANI